jgi:DNA-directed RNA polymerases I, II, and III subunit RPABC3
MDLTLDYNTELFPLQNGQNFALALASSLQRGAPGAGANDTGDDEDKDTDVWRPDGKGRKGLEEDYDYVMYGKVSSNTVFFGECRIYLSHFCRFTSSMGELLNLC